MNSWTDVYDETCYCALCARDGPSGVDHECDHDDGEYSECPCAETCYCRQERTAEEEWAIEFRRLMAKDDARDREAA